ncbi:methionine synthase [Patescibacteria group bacterium]|nr:methionine synthase [Patescibacteria group bacterium]
MPIDLFSVCKERILVFDGAMGTMIQGYNLDEDAYLGKNGCSEILNASRPNVIKEIHAKYFEVGADMVETNTFGANSVVLKEYDLENRAYELNKKAAQIARSCADDFSTSNKPRWVAGSIGPGTKLPSLKQISFDELKNSYEIQTEGLIDGGADLILIETAQDLLQVKAALVGVYSAFGTKKQKLPVMVQVTIEKNGKMLVGSDMLTAIVTLSDFPIDVLGLNCAMGPKQMSDHLKTLADHWQGLISVLPNAGMPNIKDGKMTYDLPIDEFADELEYFARDIGANIVGGCCGTSPEYIKKLSELVKNVVPKERAHHLKPSASSLYNIVAFDSEPKPLIIGERINANGSKKFRNYLLEEDYDGMIAVAQKQQKEGAHILDVCVSYTGLDEKNIMSNLTERLNTDIQRPLMIDSTDPIVIEEALKKIAGKSIINSVNLEDGGDKLRKTFSLCKKYGAAVVALTIDEEGMAKTVDKKIQIAERIFRIAEDEFDIRGHNIFFDFLTFTLGSGDDEYRNAAVETINAIKQFKLKHPQTNTILGVSNVSFGLKPDLRQRLNSVFLAKAIEYGLDAAILHAGKITPLYKIPDDEREILNNLIFNKWTFENDPLKYLLNFYEKHEIKEIKADEKKALTVEERLMLRIVEGNKNDIDRDLNEALKKHKPLMIINKILLAGMQKVGELFGDGEMQLPFVLQSAATMKAAVNYLEPYIEKTDSRKKGSIIMATVKGDVHDIGKNLVDIILSNNGFEVINIGVKKDIEEIISAYKKNNADAIGMSGLLVQSTIVMRENLEEMNRRGINPPVILGGAALTRNYVEDTLQKIYDGDVYYANDVFDGLKILTEIIEKK